jgi:hypothetical protein
MEPIEVLACGVVVGALFSAVVGTWRCGLRIGLLCGAVTLIVVVLIALALGLPVHAWRRGLTQAPNLFQTVSVPKSAPDGRHNSTAPILAHLEWLDCRSAP